MLVRRIFPVLALLPLFTALAPAEADACSPPIGFQIERAWPEDGAADVPIDGAVVVVGTGYSDNSATVEVRLGDEPIAGSVTQISESRYVWRSDAPLLPDTQYSVHIEGVSDIDPPDPASTLDLVFTTGAAPAVAPSGAVLLSSVAEAWQKEYTQCVEEEEDVGDCGQCEEFEVIKVEDRMRLVASIDGPLGPFAGFHGSRLAFGASAEDLDAFEIPQFQPGDGAMVHSIDLGLAGSWTGDEVCMRPEVEDPLGQIVQGEVSCVDISAINVPPETPDTTGGIESTGGETEEGTAGDSLEPTTGGGEEDTGKDETGESDTDVTGGQDDGGSNDGGDQVDSKGEGCSCNSDGGSAWQGMLALLGLLGFRRRRAVAT